MSASLFRPEAVAHRNAQHLGSIVLLRPLPLTLLTAVAAGIAVLALCFLFFGRYTQKATVSGVLMPQQGLIAVLSPRSGIILERRANEGQRVHKGDVLFVLSAERHSAHRGDAQAEISRQVAARRDMLARELDHQRALEREERASLSGKVRSLGAERAQLAAQIATEKRRLQQLSETLALYEKLRREGYVSAVQLEEKRDQALDREAELHALERNLVSLEREISDARTALAALPAKWSSSLSGVQREIASVEQELTESEAQRELTITATQDGVITALSAQPGQNVAADAPLASIVPAGSVLEAQLYAPSRAVGFIEAGQPVLLHYPAYPYEKFGQYAGTVSAVSRATVQRGDEPMYRITVTLSSQTVQTYGRAQPLRAGMQVEGSVLLERRRLIEWLLEPLFSVSGRL
jgi:membrane fusion protein